MLDQYDSILIGGSGFVGTRLGMHLAGLGERVLNLSRHEPEVAVSGMDFVNIDFGNPEAVAQFVFPPTNALIVLIGQISPSFDPLADRRALKAIIDEVNVQVKPVKVLYCSTALVYGDCEVSAQESDPLRPIEPYAKHKAENEDFLKNYLAPYHHLGILRLANAFGDIRSRGFISLVMTQLLSHSSEVFRVNGDGKQERDYFYVDDLAEAIVAVKSGLAGRDIVNISTGESRTLLSVLEAIQSASGRKLPFEVTHQPVVEATKIRVSNERLREIYGYTPRHSFTEGLERMWEEAVAKNVH
jgi:UDP-glucose 4-epimerase